MLVEDFREKGSLGTCFTTRASEAWSQLDNRRNLLVRLRQVPFLTSKRNLFMNTACLSQVFADLKPTFQAGVASCSFLTARAGASNFLTLEAVVSYQHRTWRSLTCIAADVSKSTRREERQNMNIESLARRCKLVGRSLLTVSS